MTRRRHRQTRGRGRLGECTSDWKTDKDQRRRLRSFFNPALQCPFAYLGAGPAEPCGWVIVGPMLGTVLPRLNMHAAKALSYCAWIDL